jgi:hypothetical protein
VPALVPPKFDPRIARPPMRSGIKRVLLGPDDFIDHYTSLAS